MYHNISLYKLSLSMYNKSALHIIYWMSQRQYNNIKHSTIKNNICNILCLARNVTDLIWYDETAVRNDDWR